MSLLVAPLLLALLAKPPLSPPPPPDSTTVRLLLGAETPELNELLSDVLRIERFQLVLNDRRLAGHQLQLTQQEYRRGQPGPEVAVTPQASLLRLDSAGRFHCAIYSQQLDPSHVQLKFRLPRAILPRTFAAEPGQAGNYSLRFGMHVLRRAANQAGATVNPAQTFSLPIGLTVVLAVYTLPYEKDDMFYYCGLSESRVPVADWYSRFRVPHYVVYRVRIE